MQDYISSSEKYEDHLRLDPISTLIQATIRSGVVQVDTYTVHIAPR